MRERESARTHTRERDGGGREEGRKGDREGGVGGVKYCSVF